MNTLARPTLRRCLTLAGGGLVAILASAMLLACADPTPTPAPTATSEPTTMPTDVPPTATATIGATATVTPTDAPASATPEPTDEPRAPASPNPAVARPAAPRPTAAPAYEVKWWADQPHLDKDLGCTAMTWEVTGAKAVYLRWPNQDEHQVGLTGRQEGVCIDEGERAVFTLRVVRPDGSQEVREMALERDD